MNAAAQGIGVALGMEPFVVRDLRTGITAFRERLVQQSADDPDMPPPRPR